MKYLDERGLKHLWAKVQELSFSSDGGGGSSSPSYFEKTYTGEHSFKCYNPMDSNQISEQSVFDTNETYEFLINGTETTSFVAAETSAEERVILENIANANSSQSVSVLEATYITNVSNWMGLLDGSVQGYILITAKCSSNGMEFYQTFYTNNVSTREYDTFEMKETLRIPFQQIFEPVLLWEGTCNEHTSLTLNDNAHKFRYLAIEYVFSLDNDNWPKIMFSPIINDIASFYTTQQGGAMVSGLVRNSYTFDMTNTGNITTIYITKLYGLY